MTIRADINVTIIVDNTPDSFHIMHLYHPKLSKLNSRIYIYTLESLSSFALRSQEIDGGKICENLVDPTLTSVRLFAMSSSFDRIERGRNVTETIKNRLTEAKQVLDVEPSKLVDLIVVTQTI